MLSRRGLITGAAALAAYSQMEDAEAFPRALLGSAGIQPPPSRQGYVYWTDSNGNNQVVTFTNNNGVMTPTTYPGGS